MAFNKSHIRSIWDLHADPQHIEDMAISVWGEDSRATTKDWTPGDHTLMKYENIIVDCEKALRGKRVLDMGCNHGLWSYMAMRHGAKHVVGIEPRGMFVDGLNAFAEQNDLPMEFHRGYDTDMGRLVREHDIDTVLMMQVDTYTDWENMMYATRKSRAEWVIMQMSALPDTWIEFKSEVFDYAKDGPGMPTGFTLHYEQHNANTRSGINPLFRDQMDPKTGYQHIDPAGDFNIEHSHLFARKKSRQYVRKFIDHAGFEVLRSKIQDTPAQDTNEAAWASGIMQWYFLHNEK